VTDATSKAAMEIYRIGVVADGRPQLQSWLDKNAARTSRLHGGSWLFASHLGQRVQSDDGGPGKKLEKAGVAVNPALNP